MRPRIRPVNGFSLIELLVALAIAAVLLAVALPSMRGLLGEGRISAATNDLVYGLQLARSEAIKRAAPAMLCPSAAPLAAAPTCDDTAWSNGWIVVADANGDGALTAADEVVQQREALEPGLSFTPAATITRGVRFDAAGGSVDAVGAPRPGDILIELDDGDQRRITVRASGRIGSVTP